MLQYIVKAPNGICRYHNSKPVWRIPNVYSQTTHQPAEGDDSEERAWPTKKPNRGVQDINVAYRHAAHLTRAHLNCKCVFEVEEV